MCDELFAGNADKGLVIVRRVNVFTPTATFLFVTV